MWFLPESLNAAGLGPSSSASTLPTATASASASAAAGRAARVLQSSSDFGGTLELLVGILCGVAFLFFLLRVVGLNRRRRSDPVDGAYLLSVFVDLLDCMADGLAVVVAISGLYWLVGYKADANAVGPPPAADSSDASSLSSVVVAAVSAKSIAVLALVVEQTGAGLSFVDWERPRKVLRPGTAAEALAPTSCWRTLLVVNEWSELAALRLSSLSARLFVVLLFFYAPGVEWSTWSIVDSGTATQYDSPFLRVGVLTAVYWVSYVAERAWLGLVWRRFASDPLGAFTDLCYLANISVFAFDTRASGHYVHGRSAMHSADTSLQELEQQACGRATTSSWFPPFFPSSFPLLLPFPPPPPENPAPLPPPSSTERQSTAPPAVALRPRPGHWPIGGASPSRSSWTRERQPSTPSSSPSAMPRPAAGPAPAPRPASAAFRPSRAAASAPTRPRDKCPIC